MHQLKINNETNTALLDLNPFFYPESVVEQAAKAFEGLCTVSHSAKANRLVVEIVPKKGSCEKAALEFLNYLLPLRKGML